MIDTETKNEYFEILDNLECDRQVVDFLKEFLETYDGTNEKELHGFMFAFITYMLKMGDIVIKAEGYDKLKDSNALTNMQKDVIKAKFEDLTNGELPETASTVVKG